MGEGPCLILRGPNPRHGWKRRPDPGVGHGQHAPRSPSWLVKPWPVSLPRPASKPESTGYLVLGDTQPGELHVVRRDPATWHHGSGCVPLDAAPYLLSRLRPAGARRACVPFPVRVLRSRRRSIWSGSPIVYNAKLAPRGERMDLPDAQGPISQGETIHGI